MGKYLQLAEQVLLKESGVFVNEEKNPQIRASQPNRPKSYCEKSELCEKSPPVLVHMLRRKLLRERRGELQVQAAGDWDEIRVDIGKLIAFADLEAIRLIRESGNCPDSYTVQTLCAGCKTEVPIFEGCPPQVEGCPWCFNRITGLPVPALNEMKAVK